MGKRELRHRKPKKHMSNTREGKGADDPSKRQPVGAFVIAIGLCVLLVATSSIALYWYKEQLRQRVRRPLDSPKISTNASGSYRYDDRFWGTYRPQTYFGMKVRSPQSPVFGLMWMTQFTGEMPPGIRHWCDQADGLPMYSWFAHDGVNFGIQTIMDKYYSVLTDFAKRSGGQHGGDWTARFQLSPRKGAETAVVSLFFYAALDGQGSIRPQLGKGNRLDAIEGFSEELGSFTVKFPQATGAKKHNYLVTYAESLAALKESMMKGMKGYMWDKGKNMLYIAVDGHRMPPGDKQPNFIVHQVTVQLPALMEVVFESESFTKRQNQLSGQVYQALLQEHLSFYDNKFEELYHLKLKGFDDDMVGFAKAALGNMIGGIGYFYGSSIVSSPQTKEPLEYWKAPLYTAVPSRPFFPRGFLWDEGFHNLLISKFNSEISKDIIGHWLDLMNIDGWIPREQILGDEARAKVPEQFIVQKNQNANPPTLFLPLHFLVEQMITSNKSEDKIYLKHLFPRLKVWYNWYNTTQLGSTPFTYRWRGRDPDDKKQLNPLTLTSGLDDFPRASHPTDDERHIDLRCWIALASDIMAKIAQAVGQPYEQYQSTYQILTDNKLLDELHWSEKGQQYSDYGLHTDHVKLVRPHVPRQPGAPPPQVDKERVTKKPPKKRFVDSLGYVSLFPFLFKFIEPNSWKLGKILKDLQDPNQLWTKYGIRSLAKSTPLYHKHNTEHDPPYWRGAIWINFNYLTLRALHHYAHIEGPHKETAGNIYKELRQNVVTNMYTQFRTTGYIWENYDDETGKGKGSHPFTGWSALVLAIMAEEY